MIYFDHNATTPVDEQVVEAMQPYLHSMFGNPSSLYRLGRIARSAIDTAREQLAALVDCEPGQIIFTSGGSEANLLALANVGNSGFISSIEHPSVVENTRRAQQRIGILEVDDCGLIKQSALTQANLQAGDFVSIMLANNETGVIQDIAEIAAELVAAGVIVHSDAVQALAKMPLSFKKLGIHLMSLSSHKIYGPKGCGALVVAKDLPIQAVQHGGGQEFGFRGGTENVAAIVGFGKAAEIAANQLTARITKLTALRLSLEQQLKTIPGLVIFAEHAHRLANTVQFGINGSQGEMLLMQMDKLNIAVSSGSACAAGSGEISPVLAAMGVPAELAKAAIRVSLGKDNNEQEVNEFVEALKSQLNIDKNGD
ncbi:cysteine desulfurase [Methylomonas paludis]|uniref:cysteine desulfurase n=1 Tax=Methylomonas paludis TaxID=1173101 RepID=A0A975MMV2_9GAMM|nr:cysteine desulfurase family protein [Methylomonas paludis]QWF70529.1 cysteine desulfurase [Methylomonas paludis]